MNHATKKLIGQRIKSLKDHLKFARESREKSRARTAEYDRDIADMESELHDLKETLGV